MPASTFSTPIAPRYTDDDRRARHPKVWISRARTPEATADQRKEWHGAPPVPVTKRLWRPRDAF